VASNSACFWRERSWIPAALAAGDGRLLAASAGERARERGVGDGLPLNNMVRASIFCCSRCSSADRLILLLDASSTVGSAKFLKERERTTFETGRALVCELDTHRSNYSRATLFGNITEHLKLVLPRSFLVLPRSLSVV
jgi:hypothetical protein